MKLLLRLLFLLPILLIVGLVGLVLALFQSQPLVNRTADLTPERIAEGKRIFDSNDPRKLRPGQVRNVSFTEQDLDLALNYLANQYGRGSAKLSLGAGRAHVQATGQLPVNPLGVYVNVDAEWTEVGGMPQVGGLRIGHLGIPAGLANWLLGQAASAMGGSEDYRVFTEVVKQVNMADGRLSVTYEWQKDLRAKLSNLLVPAADQERLRAYQQRLAEVAAKGKGSVSLAELMPPLFKLAAERSAGGGAADENRAVIVVLTFYIENKDLAKIVPQAKDWKKPLPRHVKLSGRDDFPKHFIISAALSANAGTPLSDAVGLFKEVDDSRGGSGFSFNDIAADRAGALFGEKAVASPASAQKLQQFLSGALREADFMPSVEGLPEFMPEAEFKSRFGGIGAPAYNKMMQDIERRIAALPSSRL
ncbi:MAG: hypothetical protein ACKN9T_00965 [Candidatus Methylumidiphilus sp.]